MGAGLNTATAAFRCMKSGSAFIDSPGAACQILGRILGSMRAVGAHSVDLRDAPRAGREQVH
jgi:hypothetical protein